MKRVAFFSGINYMQSTRVEYSDKWTKRTEDFSSFTWMTLSVPLNRNN